MRKTYITPRIKSITPFSPTLQATSDIPPRKIRYNMDDEADPEEDVL